MIALIMFAGFLIGYAIATGLLTVAHALVVMKHNAIRREFGLPERKVWVRQ